MRGIQEFYAGREYRERQIGRLPELQNQYDAIMTDGGALDILITEDQVVDVVRTLEKLADDMNVQMSILSKDEGKIVERKKPAVPPARTQAAEAEPSVQGAVKQKPVDIIDDVPFSRYLRVSVEAEGNYADIIAFLHKLETLSLGLDVVGIDMKETDKELSDQPFASGARGNPFAILGDDRDVAAQPQALVRGDVEAAFDVLIYVDKNPDL